MTRPRLERRCHWLSTNRGDRRPSALLFLDVETRIDRPDYRTQEHSFKLAVACFCVYSPDQGLQPHQWRYLTSGLSLWEWAGELAREHKRLLVVAHNIDFDARASRAFYHLPRLGWTPSYCIMARSCTLFEWEWGDCKIKLLDNGNWWVASLKALGDSVGLPKLEIDFDAASDRDLFTYCKRDVQILVRLWRDWLAFLDQHRLGDFGITAARQAFNAYRHRFMPCKIGIHDHPEAAELARAAFHGGRSEAFQVGRLPEGEYYQVDVNGLYAAMMTWYPQPRRLVKIVHNVAPAYLDHLLRDYLAVAEVVVEAQAPVYVYQIGGRNCYPIGSFLTTLTTPELAHAVIFGELRGVGRVALYEPADLFSDYVAFFTDLRRQYQASGDQAHAQMCKLFRNSLQGKFGQLGHEQEVIGQAPLDEVKLRRWVDLESGRSCTDWTFAGAVIRQSSGGETFDSLPAIPAHVAAYGRMYMWSLIELAGRDHVYYIDTDSLIVDAEGYARLFSLVQPDRLGHLKLEGIAREVEIRARKDYTLGSKVVRKGVRSKAREVAPGTFQQWHFTTLRFAFMTKDLSGVTVRRVEKRLRYGAVAGEVLPDGRIRPPCLALDPRSLVECRPDRERGVLWTWEVDKGWAERQERRASLRRRLISAFSPSVLLRPLRALTSRLVGPS